MAAHNVKLRSLLRAGFYQDNETLVSFKNETDHPAKKSRMESSSRIMKKWKLSETLALAEHVAESYNYFKTCVKMDFFKRFLAENPHLVTDCTPQQMKNKYATMEDCYKKVKLWLKNSNNQDREPDSTQNSSTTHAKILEKCPWFDIFDPVMGDQMIIEQEMDDDHYHHISPEIELHSMSNNTLFLESSEDSNSSDNDVLIPLRNCKDEELMKDSKSSPDDFFAILLRQKIECEKMKFDLQTHLANKKMMLEEKKLEYKKEKDEKDRITALKIEEMKIEQLKLQIEIEKLKRGK